MSHRIHRVLAAVLFAVAFPSAPALAQAKSHGAALGKQMQQVANRFVSAIRRTRPLKGFMSKRVTVTYKTDDRTEGTFKGKVVVAAAKIDGVVAVPGMTGGYAWAIEKKIKPRPKTVKLQVGKRAYAILKYIRAAKLQRRITVDKKKLTFYIEASSDSMTFHFRLEEDKALRVYKLGFSDQDPG